jgi:hypothetical protein
MEHSRLSLYQYLTCLDDVFRNSKRSLPDKHPWTPAARFPSGVKSRRKSDPNSRIRHGSNQLVDGKEARQQQFEERLKLKISMTHNFENHKSALEQLIENGFVCAEKRDFGFNIFVHLLEKP